MNNCKFFLRILKTNRQKAPNSFRNFHSLPGLSQRQQANSMMDSNPHIDRSLFFTNLPNKRRERKVRTKFVNLNLGTLVIDCKNKALNHYSGMHYGNLQVVPLASKGWAHKKSKGDYFTVLPKDKYSPFLADEDLPRTFEECQISEQVNEQLKKLNIVQPTVIQVKAIQKLLTGENVLILGECGSGKTLAYVIGLIENVLKWKKNIPPSINSPLGIIVVSSRELALQVLRLASSIGSDLGLCCEALIEGYSKSLLENPPTTEVDILVTTAPAMIKQLRAKIYSTEFCKHVIVDDADSFEIEEKYECLRKFFGVTKLNYTGLNSPKVTPNSAQVCFACAVSPSTLRKMLADFIMMNDITIVSTSHMHKLLYNVPQKFMRLSHYMVPRELLITLKHNVKTKKPTLLFSNSNASCNWVSLFLKENGVECLTMNKKDNPSDRLQNFRDFEAGFVPALSVTNMLSLGFHFPNVKHIINVEFPNYMTDYIHRCGRVGRLGQADDCLITNFITGKNDVELVQKIEKATRTNSALPSIYYPKTYQKSSDSEFEW